MLKKASNCVAKYAQMCNIHTMKEVANIHCRIDPILKKGADAVLHHLGLNMTDAIRIFLAQIVLKDGIPFDVKIPNKKTIAAIEESKVKSKLYKASSLDNLFKELSK